MFDYTIEYVRKTLFEHHERLEISSSPVWTDEFTPWMKENIHSKKRLIPEEIGYECLQGYGTVTGPLFGGCIDTFMIYNGTTIWPKKSEFEGTILFLETSEDYPTPELLTWLLRNLAAQGVFDVICGVLFAKPMDEKYYEEYKAVLCQVIGKEEHHPDLPILYNLNFGHSTPRCVLPYGIKAEINCEKKTLALIEPATN
jgi:muramoyltetrapeptide carboxypeptidase LdcA involved in peptidoglycan recycling